MLRKGKSGLEEIISLMLIKSLYQAIMKRSRLKNKATKIKDTTDIRNCKKQ